MLSPKELKRNQEAGRLCRTRAIAIYMANPNICPNCGEILSVKPTEKPGQTRRRKFCNNSCAAQYSNRRRVRKRKDRPSCLFCETKLPATNTKFCNKECMLKYNAKIYIQRVEKLGYIRERREGRKYLLLRDGNKCSLCGLTTWKRTPVPVVLDHIDGNPTNNILSNLRLVCRNCDGLLPTFAGKNRGFGRKSRGLKFGSKL